MRSIAKKPHSSYLLKSQIDFFCEHYPYFGNESYQVQHRLIEMMHEVRERPFHEAYAGCACVPYQNLDKQFGRRKFSEINQRLNMFDVTKYDKRNGTTRGYALTPFAENIYSKWLQIDAGEEYLVDVNGKILRTPLKAIADVDHRLMPTKKWKHVAKIKCSMPVDVDALKQLRQKIYLSGSCDDRCPKSIGLLLKYTKVNLKGWQGSPRLNQQYFFIDSVRLYSNSVPNMQTMPKLIRNAVLNGCWDYDIENCHYAIFSALAKRAGVSVPYIDYYLDNKRMIRSTLACAVQIDLEQSKKILISILYGATKSNRLKNSLPSILKGESQKIENLYENPIFLGIYDEIKRGRHAILNSIERDRRKYITNVSDGRCLKSENSKVKLAHILQGYEALALKSIITRYGNQVVLYMHDGWVLETRQDVTDMEQIVSQATGIQLRLSEQEITTEMMRYPVSEKGEQEGREGGRRTNRRIRQEVIASTK